MKKEIFFVTQDFTIGTDPDRRGLRYEAGKMYYLFLPPTEAEELGLGKFYEFEFPTEELPGKQRFGGRTEGQIYAPGALLPPLMYREEIYHYEGIRFFLHNESGIRCDWYLAPVAVEPIGEPRWEGLYGNWKLDGPFGREWLLNGFLGDVVQQVVEIAFGFVKPGAIETTHYQSWKVVGFLRGLGLRHERTEYGDEFISPLSVERVWDGWGDPSKDGSRLTDWSDLSDPASPHFGRRYVEAFRFRTPEGHENVVAFSASPHNSGELRTLIGLSSYHDWKVMVEDEPGRFGFVHWLEYNGITIR